MKNNNTTTSINNINVLYGDYIALGAMAYIEDGKVYLMDDNGILCYGDADDDKVIEDACLDCACQISANRDLFL